MKKSFGCCVCCGVFLLYNDSTFFQYADLINLTNEQNIFYAPCTKWDNLRQKQPRTPSTCTANSS